MFTDDFATANIKDGTGGIDGSIAYELDRNENAGEAYINITTWLDPGN